MMSSSQNKKGNILIIKFKVLLVNAISDTGH